MPRCGSQLVFCDMPVRFDTYGGCTHNCEYCFAKRDTNLTEVDFGEGVAALRRFIEGKRTKNTAWVDWDIPIHWGGVSDPFQPLERKYGRSLECLELLAETQYPVVISTKGKLLCEEPYISLLAKCNAMVQVSMVVPQMDAIERGAPSFGKRLEMLAKLGPNCKRLIVRCQPYSLGFLHEIRKHLPKYKEAGVYGVIVEGIKRVNKYPGFEKVGNDWCLPIEPLRKDFELLREWIHNAGMQFFAAENRLRAMGDSPSCCGVVGMEGFVPHVGNMSHMDADGNIPYTSGMLKPGSAVGLESITQTTVGGHVFSNMTLADAIEMCKTTKAYMESMGINGKPKPQADPFAIQLDVL